MHTGAFFFEKFTKGLLDELTAVFPRFYVETIFKIKGALKGLGFRSGGSLGTIVNLGALPLGKKYASVLSQTPGLGAILGLTWDGVWASG